MLDSLKAAILMWCLAVIAPVSAQPRGAGPPSLGKRVNADPRIWRIVDGKRYLFASVKARDMADKDLSRLDRTRDAYLNPDERRTAGN